MGDLPLFGKVRLTSLILALDGSLTIQKNYSNVYSNIFLSLQFSDLKSGKEKEIEKSKGENILEIFHAASCQHVERKAA